MCVVHKLSVVRDAADVKKKIVRPRTEDGATSDGIEFISSDHLREVALMPLVGERRYYLPLSSDHYSLDHAGSFTGKRNKWSPPSELEDGLAGHSNVEWANERNECPSLFTKSFPKVYTLSEVKAAIAAAGADPNREPLPPMVGTVRVKSKVTHLGDPDVSSEFPFAFHIVLGKLSMLLLLDQVGIVTNSIPSVGFAAQLTAPPPWKSRSTGPCAPSSFWVCKRATLSSCEGINWSSQALWTMRTRIPVRFTSLGTIPLAASFTSPVSGAFSMMCSVPA